MAHTFTIIPSDEIQVVIGRVRSTITEYGGSFLGDEGSGSFFGRTPLGFIKGEYFCATEKEIRVTIIDKPFLLPYRIIESKIREYFG
jgi:hypothetical protein